MRATHAKVDVFPTGLGSEFRITATWGKDSSHTMVVGSEFIRATGNVQCTKDYARKFIREVLEKRGVL